jgi:hypothetical protein
VRLFLTKIMVLWLVGRGRETSHHGDWLRKWRIKWLPPVPSIHRTIKGGFSYRLHVLYGWCALWSKPNSSNGNWTWEMEHTDWWVNMHAEVA